MRAMETTSSLQWKPELFGDRWPADRVGNRPKVAVVFGEYGAGGVAEGGFVVFVGGEAAHVA